MRQILILIQNSCINDRFATDIGAKTKIKKKGQFSLKCHLSKYLKLFILSILGFSLIFIKQAISLSEVAN